MRLSTVSTSCLHAYPVDPMFMCMCYSDSTAYLQHVVVKHEEMSTQRHTSWVIAPGSLGVPFQVQEVTDYAFTQLNYRLG